MTTNYYTYADHFNVEIDLDLLRYMSLPQDAKRIKSKGNATYNNRMYFISETEREVFRVHYNSGLFWINKLSQSKNNNVTKVNLLTDNNKHASLCLSERMFDKIKNMNEIHL